MKTIDLTPTWAEILPALLLLLSNGTLEGRETAERELRRMAALATEYVAQKSLASL